MMAEGHEPIGLGPLQVDRDHVKGIAKEQQLLAQRANTFIDEGCVARARCVIVLRLNGFSKS